MSLVGGWKTASFLVGSESNVRHWGPLPAGPVRPSGPCCFAVARAPFVSFLGGWKTASFLERLRKSTSLRALLVRMWLQGAVCEHCWRLEDS